MEAKNAEDAFIGLVIDGKYTIIEQIGRGGMGSVYRARQDAIGRDVAIKFLTVTSFDESREQFVIRFKREAETASKIRHPAAITIFDYGVGNFGKRENCPYLVMEYIDGQTLKEIYNEGRVSPERLLPLILQVCGALEEAHSLGIIHRDLKPENIMVSKRLDGTEWAHVLDFGIAKQIVSSGADTSLTREGSVMGTPRYMAPEQIWQKPIDARTDLYSLALVIYEGLTGSLPIEGTSLMDIAIKISAQEAEPISKRVPDLGLPKALERTIMRALRKDPDERPSSAREFGAELVRNSPPDFKFSSGSLRFAGFMRRKTPRSLPVVSPDLAPTGSNDVTALKSSNARTYSLALLAVFGITLAAYAAISPSKEAPSPESPKEVTATPKSQSKSKDDERLKRELEKDLLSEEPVVASTPEDLKADKAVVSSIVPPSKTETSPNAALVVPPQQQPVPEPQPVVQTEKSVITEKPVETQPQGTPEVTPVKQPSVSASTPEMTQPVSTVTSKTAMSQQAKEAEETARRLREAEERARQLEREMKALEQQRQIEEQQRKLQEARRRKAAAAAKKAVIDRNSSNSVTQTTPLTGSATTRTTPTPTQTQQTEPEPEEERTTPPRKLMRRCGPNWCP